MAGLDPASAVAAARDPRYDLRLDATSRGLLLRGIVSPPAISIGTQLVRRTERGDRRAVAFSAARARRASAAAAGRG